MQLNAIPWLARGLENSDLQFYLSRLKSWVCQIIENGWLYFSCFSMYHLTTFFMFSFYNCNIEILTWPPERTQSCAELQWELEMSIHLSCKLKVLVKELSLPACAPNCCMCHDIQRLRYKYWTLFFILTNSSIHFQIYIDFDCKFYINCILCWIFLSKKRKKRMTSEHSAIDMSSHRVSF